MATLKDKVLRLIGKFKEATETTDALKAENADLKQKLAIALSDDVADDEAIREAQTAASIAKVELAESRFKMEAIAAEQDELIAALDGLGEPVEETPPTPATPSEPEVNPVIEQETGVAPTPGVAEKRSYLAEVPSNSPATPTPNLLSDEAPF